MMCPFCSSKKPVDVVPCCDGFALTKCRDCGKGIPTSPEGVSKKIFTPNEPQKETAAA